LKFQQKIQGKIITAKEFKAKKKEILGLEGEIKISEKMLRLLKAIEHLGIVAIQLYHVSKK